MCDLNNTALVIIDVQMGLFEKTTPVYNADSLIDNLCMLIDRAHTANIPVFFLEHSNEKIKMGEGSAAWRLHPRLQPVETDRKLPKHHSSAFEETTLEEELKTRGIQRLVVTGLVTHGCVQATCQDAHRRGFQVILVKDGHSSYSKQAKELIEEWNEKLSQGIVELKEAREIDFVEDQTTALHLVK
jgi:nicotinamidase-related amidase